MENKNKKNTKNIKNTDNKKQTKRKGSSARTKGPKSTLRIIPLGGIGEVGKNMTVIEYGDSMIVVDCGLIFPEHDLLGIDYVIPDITYLENNSKKLKGFFITHGHEDHIGALPYVIPKFDVPIYGTRLTLALIDIKFQEHNIDFKKFRTVEAGEKVKCGPFEVEFIRVSHSIDDAVAFAIRTPEGIIVHTGDFKIDYTPIDGKIADIHRFSELGEQGVLALLSDSTNAENPGFTISERTVGESFEKYMSEAKGRIIIATFASNIHRLQQVVDVAKKYNKRICLTGRSILKITKVATELGYLSIPEKMLVEMDEVDRIRDNRLVILATGSQGEPMSGLVRMASGEHPKIHIKQGDLVIFSSSSIPGNEKNISHLLNSIYRQGATVINSEMAQVHVSGHACQEEQKLMLAMVKPKYFIPVHGEERQLYSHANLAYEMGMKKKQVFITSIGTPVEFSNGAAKLGEPVESGVTLVDGLGVGDIGSSVLKDRTLLSENGLFVVVISLSGSQRGLVTAPEIVTRGFVYAKESEELLSQAKKLVIKSVEECFRERTYSYNAIRGKVRNTLYNFLYNKTKRTPMILPVIVEV